MTVPGTKKEQQEDGSTLMGHLRPTNVQVVETDCGTAKTDNHNAASPLQFFPKPRATRLGGPLEWKMPKIINHQVEEEFELLFVELNVEVGWKGGLLDGCKFLPS